MNTIDSESPCQIGHDTQGKSVRLGSTDSDGYFVGYIDEEGLAWRSCEERDKALTSSALHQAYLEWVKAGKPAGKAPIASHIAFEVCQRSENVPTAAQSARDALYKPLIQGLPTLAELAEEHQPLHKR